MRQRLVQLLPRLSGLASAGSSGARVAPVACQLLNARSFADEASLLKTPLYDFHVEHGGACPQPGCILSMLHLCQRFALWTTAGSQDSGLLHSIGRTS